MKMIRLLFMSVVAFLAACQFVSVEMSSLATPTPMPTVIEPIPTAIAPTLVPGRSVTDYTGNDDSNVVVRTVAYPHLVFEQDVIRIEPMEQEIPAQEYMALSSGYGVRMRVDWRILWLSDIYGMSTMTVDLGVHSPGSDTFETWESASTEAMENWGPGFRNELLDVTFYPSEAGVYHLNTVVGVSASETDEIQDSRELNWTNEVIVLSGPPDEMPESYTDFQPAFGDLESNRALMDWRGWAFGPCAVESEDLTLTRLMDTACTSVENGDFTAADSAVQEALDTVSEDPAMSATLRGHLGLMAAAQGHWNSAARHFRESLDLWQAQDDAYHVGISLHNLAISLVAAGRWGEGVPLLQQSGQLRDQLGDYGGAALTWSQLGIYWDAPWMIRDHASQLQDYGLPQADFLWPIADAIEAEQNP